MNKEIKPLFDVLNEVDGIATEIGMALDVLEMYDNFMDEEVRNLDPNELWTTALFLNRHSMGSSTLSMCKDKLYSCLEKLNAAADNGMKIAQQIGKGGEAAQ